MLIEGKLHKSNYFFVQVFKGAHPEMVIELLCSGYTGDLMETEIFGVGLIKREHDIHEIFPKPGDIGHPCPGRKSDHAFGGMHCDLTDLLIPVREMFEQRQTMFCFTLQEICQYLIAAGMLLVVFYKLLVTQGDRST
jgi:hypothetical protein